MLCIVNTKQRITIRVLFANAWFLRIMIRILYAVYTRDIRIINYTRIIRLLCYYYTYNYCIRIMIRILYAVYMWDIRIINYMRIIHVLYVNYMRIIRIIRIRCLHYNDYNLSHMYPSNGHNITGLTSVICFFLFEIIQAFL